MNPVLAAMSTVRRLSRHPSARRWAALLLAHGLFWSWNLMFVAFAVFGIGPLLVELIGAVVEGVVPPGIAFGALLALMAPLASLPMGVVLRRSPARLVAFFFGVEVPVMMLLLVRLFGVRELTAGAVVAGLLVIIGVGGLLIRLLVEGRPRSTALAAADLALATVLLAVGLHLGLLLSIYAVPAGVAVLGGLREMVLHVLTADFWRGLARFVGHFADAVAANPAVLLSAAGLGSGIALVAWSSTLFVASPLALVAIAVGRFVDAVRRSSGVGVVRLVVVGATLLAVIGATVVANRQPQHLAFALLAEEPTDEAGRAALVQRSDEIRRGLVAAWLAPYRYWSDAENSRSVRMMYARQLGWGADTAQAVQDLHDRLLLPMIYDGDLYADPRRAAELYAAFFDRPIEAAERQAAVAAVRTTWSRTDAAAGLLDVGQRRVLLEEQDVVVHIDGQVAQIELRETYVAQTTQDEEVLYHFTLPETAALTGLWLSEDPDDPHQFPFVVSPRGAAQQVYRDQVRRRVDPALLEQVGPRQFRLRAFPVRGRDWRRDVAPPMYLKMTMTLLADDDGFALPRLLEQRNVFWDHRTVRKVNGQRVEAHDDWLAAPLPEVEREPVEMGVGERTLSAVPLSGGPKAIGKGRRYAVVLDRSRSMEDVAPAWLDAVEWLDGQVAPANTVDWYLGGPEPRLLPDAPRRLLWWGRETPHQLLAHFEALRGDRAYDGILVLTDAGIHDPDGAVEVAVPDAPLWLVHLGGAFPVAYDDPVLEAVTASGGGVVEAAPDALRRLSLWEAEDEGWIAGDWLWTGRMGEERPAGALAAVGARQLVGQMARSLDLGELDTLDEVHAVAKGHGIVTAWSSMIVLVDDRQRAALAEAEAGDDRFDREHETGEGELTPPTEIVGVPEPEEWALLVVGALLLLGARRGSAAVATA